MNSVLQLCDTLGQQLISRHKRLGVAESCTGGLVAAAITAIPGSSLWFERGLVTYSNQAKQELLQISSTLIEAHGAVSEEVVSAMATGVLKVAPVDFSIAVSGIAGPEGGSVQKPLGTVWIAWGQQHATQTQLFHFSGDRDAVRQAAVRAAIQGLLDRI